jgi:hypothetical protein
MQKVSWSQKQEFIDVVEGRKQADAIEHLLPTPFDKQAQAGAEIPGGTISKLNSLHRALILASVLGTGWITKRVLDQNLKDKERAGLELDKTPKIRRIVIQSPDEQEKVAGDVRFLQVKVSFLKDMLSVGKAWDLNEVKEASARMGIDPSAREKLTVTEQYANILKLADSTEVNALLEKVADLPSVEGLVVPAITEPADEADEFADEIIRAQERAKANAPVVKHERGTVAVDAQGKDAQKYLDANKERLAEVVRRLAEQGQV